MLAWCQEWCRAHGAEVLAVQPPGRAMRGREPPITSATDLAAAVFPVVASRLAVVPYVVSQTLNIPSCKSCFSPGTMHYQAELICNLPNPSLFMTFAACRVRLHTCRLDGLSSNPRSDVASLTVGAVRMFADCGAQRRYLGRVRIHAACTLMRAAIATACLSVCYGST